MPHQIRLAELNRDTLRRTDPAFNNPTQKWKIDAIPAAFDTMQLIKLMLLSPSGFTGLKTALAGNRAVINVRDRNVMPGWVTSLDHGNQW